MVIEGDINIGSVTTVKLSYVTAFGDENKEKVCPDGVVSVEDENGQSYFGNLKSKENGTSAYTVPLQAAKNGVRYRLRVHNNDNGKDYVSDWVTAIQAPKVSPITHSYDMATGRVQLYMSFHSTDNAKYFIWSYDEMWMHNAMYPSSLTYDYSVNKMFSQSPNTYYCWNKFSDSQLHIISGESAGSEGVVVDNEVVASYDHNNIRFNNTYKLAVRVQAMDEDAYEYYINLRQISYPTGSLFTPVPSELPGNLHCEQDPEELVYGYISGSAPTISLLTLYNSETNYYIGKYHDDDQETIRDAKTEWRDAYNEGYRPLRYENRHYYWAKERCMNCLLSGGTNIEPAEWKDFGKY